MAGDPPRHFVISGATRGEIEDAWAELTGQLNGQTTFAGTSGAGEENKAVHPDSLHEVCGERVEETLGGRSSDFPHSRAFPSPLLSCESKKGGQWPSARAVHEDYSGGSAPDFHGASQHPPTKC